MSKAFPFRGSTALAVLMLLVAAVLATGASAAPGAACGFCGKNLIKNPGAEGGAGITAVGAFGAVPRLDDTGGPVRRRLVHLPERLVLREVEGLAEPRQELLLRRDDAGGHHRQGDDRQADDQASRRGGREEGDARWLARELRPKQLRSKIRAEFADAGGAVLAPAQHRARHDDLGHRHGVPQPQGHRPARRNAGHDRRDVRGTRSEPTSSRAPTTCRSCSPETATRQASRSARRAGACAPIPPERRQRIDADGEEQP